MTSSTPEVPTRQSLRLRVREWFHQRRLPFAVAGLVSGLLFVYLIPSIFYSVLPGEAAVVWFRFFGGTDINLVKGEGLRAKFPWDQAYIYDTRLQEKRQTFDVLTSDGLKVEMEISIRFRLHKTGLGALHKFIGPNYVEVLIFPEVGALARELVTEYRPADLYSQQRGVLQDRMLALLTDESLLMYEYDGEPQRAIHVEDVLIRNIALPPMVVKAIEEKLSQEQNMLEYDFRLRKEKKERERKRIEAQGIRIFQDIVSDGINERYLQWKGIDATLELARSNNAKIIVIGAGSDGLPIILGGLDSMAPTVQQAPKEVASPVRPSPGTTATPGEDSPPR